MSAARIAALSEGDRALLAWFEIQALREARDKRRTVNAAVRSHVNVRACA